RPGPGGGRSRPPARPTQPIGTAKSRPQAPGSAETAEAKGDLSRLPLARLLPVHFFRIQERGWAMRRLLPDPVVGAMAGFVLGFLASFRLVSLGVDRASGLLPLGLGVLGAVG